MQKIVDPKLWLEFPTDPTGDFTFHDEDFMGRSQAFYELFTMEDDRRQIKSMVRINWELFKYDFN
jgi:hypothetical protein